MERKRVDLSWYEKHDITENELGYIEQLLDIGGCGGGPDNPGHRTIRLFRGGKEHGEEGGSALVHTDGPV